MMISLFTLLSQSKILNHQKILGTIQGLVGSLFGGAQEQSVAAISNSQAQNVFNKLKKTSLKQGKSRIQTLINQIKNPIEEQKDSKLTEFFGHLIRDANTFDQLIFDANHPLELLPRKYFTIEMWDKFDPATFSLGSYVGCCLAPDGGHFKALIERRLDQAMFMHVVRDCSTNKPVSLSWLFYASSTENPSDIYVVSNFVEIAAGLGSIEGYRDPIVQALNEYTARFAQAVNAKGFILRPLNYGLVPDYRYGDKLEVKINKVGGFLRVDDDEEPYYLDALKCSAFHVFKLTEPNSTHRPVIHGRSKRTRSEFEQPTVGSLNPTERKLKRG